jgi:GTP-binding protein Era
MSEPMDHDLSGPTLPHAGMVAVVGRANVGKSSLVNAILGEKISIVSPVAQTTRNMVRGVLTEARGQLVLVDTPGVHKAESDLGRVMNRTARAASEGVDAVMLVLDSSVQPGIEDEGWMKRLATVDMPVVAVLNKSDLGAKHEPALRAMWSTAAADRSPGREPLWVSISASTGEGVPALTDAVFGLLPPGPALFPEDVLTDYPRKLAMADVIREKLFLELRDELPHAVAVWINKVEDAGPGLKIDGAIYVNKPSQKGIVIGHKGRLLRKVRRSSEAELQALYERPVDLHLWVRVEPNWNRNFWLLKKFGYVAT